MREIVLGALPLAMLVLPLGARAAPAQTSAQDTVVVPPGDARLAPERLVPHRATWRVTVVDEDGSSTVQGLWTDVWARSEEEGRPVVVFRQLFVDTLGAVLVDNETWFDASSFRALRSTQRLPPSGGRVSYTFQGDTASGTLSPSADAEPSRFTVVFDDPFWDPLAPVPTLLPLEGFEPGTVIRYPIWNQAGSGGDVTWRTVRVDSMAPLEAPDGTTVDTWHLTWTTDATPGAVLRNLRRPEPPYGWWLRVERPGLTREWTLVDWQPFVAAGSGAG